LTNHERTGHRDLTYNRWHRPDRLTRYLGGRAADACGMVDIDGFEYCRFCYEPLALVETARQVYPKDANATVRLGRTAGVTVYSLAFDVDGTDEVRCSECNHIIEHGDITCFRIRQLWPTPVIKRVETLTPKQWANCLAKMREEHWLDCPKKPAPLDWEAVYATEAA
jgi:hypothetical protein